MCEVAAAISLEPQWYIALFAVMWFGIGALLSRLGGWSSLASQFRAAQPASGDSFHFVSGSMGRRSFPVHYGSCLSVAVGDSGFYLSTQFIFRFQCPPLFLPWSQLESIEEKRFLFARYQVIRVRNKWPIVSIHGRAGQRIKEVYEAAHGKGAL